MKPLLTIVLLSLALTSAAAASDPPEAMAAAEIARARAELDRARGELEQARSELNATSSKIAELSLRIAREDIEAAMASPAFDRPVVGLILGSDPESGARIAGVTPKGPAARAGLRSGDRLLAVDDVPIGSGSAEQRRERASEILASLEAGQVLRIDYQRDGRRQRVEVTAEHLPGLAWWRDGGGGVDAEALRAQLAPLVAMRGLLPLERIAPIAPCVDDGPCMEADLIEHLRWRGLRLAPIEPRLGRYFGTERGVLVLSAEGSPLVGVEPGDVLLQVAGEATDEPADVLRALRDRDLSQTVPVTLLRDRSNRTLQLEAAALPTFPGIAPPAPLEPPRPPVAPRAPAPPAPAFAPPPPLEPPPRGVLDRVLR